jgi:hypothetical protein
MSSSGIDPIRLDVFARSKPAISSGSAMLCERSTRRQQVEMLEDHADRAARLAQRFLVQRSDVRGRRR